MNYRVIPLVWPSGRMWLIMKLTVFLLFGALLQVSASVYSQNAKLDLNLKNANFEQVFIEIQKQSDFDFLYKTELLEGMSRVAIKVKKATIHEVLEQILPDHLEYEIYDKTVIIKQKPENERRKPTQTSKVEDQQPVTGKVLDDEGEGLPNVNVLIKGTSSGTVSDIDGNFSLNVSDRNATLVFSSIGFETQEVAINGRSFLEVSMNVDVQALEEIVIIGYGQVKKSDLTGSIASVTEKELIAYPALSAVQSLQGRAAGVQVTNNNGEPGAPTKVRVRGGTSINASSDPIFVVDGFVGGTLPPPEDIASIEILKDASATAIYGSRGANGVILVTTKRGEQGKTRITLNASTSFQQEINRLDLLNTNQFIDYIQETNPDFTSMGANTDWQDEIFRNGAIQNIQVGVSGGSENVKYYVSGTVFDQKGIVLGSDYARYSATSNIDIQATDYLKLGLNLFARRTNRNGVVTQEGSGGANGVGVISSAFKFEPDQGIFDDEGNYTIARLNDAHDNPVAILNEYTSENENDRLQGNFFAEVKIIEGLAFKTTLGISTENFRTGEYTPSVLQSARGVGGSGAIRSGKNSLLLSENYLTYNKDVGIGELNVVAGYSYQQSVEERWDARGQTFVTDASLFWDLDGSSTWLSPASSLDEWELASWYTRLNFAFLDRFVATFTARYDGSSTFSEDNKWAFFPSGAVAWDMSEESFMQGAGFISQWKWRVSYGLTGNRAINPYQTLARFGNVFTIQNGQPINAVAPANVANNNLTWETTGQFDVGADISLFNDRVNLVVDYYRMETNDLLFSVPLPEYSGFGTQLKNVGSVENKGFEFTLNAVPVQGLLTWRTGLNISTNRNEILELPDGVDILYSSGPGHMVGLGQTQILREGHPVGSFFGFLYDGVYQEGEEFLPGGGFEQEAGGERFRDVSGADDVPDGQLNNDDRVIIGNPHPDFIWGWDNNLEFKGFDLNFFVQGSQGNDLYSYTLMELDLLAGLNNATTAALDRWTPTNTNTDVPRATTGRARRASTRFVQDGSFIRLKNIALGYTLPSSLLNNIGVESLRVYISGQNLLTITDYEGYDPEVNYRSDANSTDSNRNLGLDYGSYPNAKAVTLGVNLGF